MPNISIQTSDIIELTYSVSNDTTKLNNILDIKRGDIYKDLSDEKFKDIKKFTWEPPNDSSGETYTFELEGESEDLIVNVLDIPESVKAQDLVAWYRFEDGDARDYTSSEEYSHIKWGDSTSYNGQTQNINYNSTGGVTDFQNGTNSGAFDFSSSDNKGRIDIPFQINSNTFTWCCWATVT
jgi:hypothetical protein